MQPFLLNTEGDPKNQPDKSSRLNINVNLTSELGSIVTEDGNDPLHLYPTIETFTAVTIGKIPLLDGKESFCNGLFTKSILYVILNSGDTPD